MNSKAGETFLVPSYMLHLENFWSEFTGLTSIVEDQLI